MRTYAMLDHPCRARALLSDRRDARYNQGGKAKQ
jgi:hypothetical protein